MELLHSNYNIAVHCLPEYWKVCIKVVLLWRFISATTSSRVACHRRTDSSGASVAHTALRAPNCVPTVKALTLKANRLVDGNYGILELFHMRVLFAKDCCEHPCLYCKRSELFSMNCAKKETRPRWDSNPQSLAPEASALSIRPRGLMNVVGVIMVLIREILIGLLDLLVCSFNVVWNSASEKPKQSSNTFKLSRSSAVHWCLETQGQVLWDALQNLGFTWVAWLLTEYNVSPGSVTAENKDWWFGAFSVEGRLQIQNEWIDLLNKSFRFLTKYLPIDRMWKKMGHKLHSQVILIRLISGQILKIICWSRIFK